MKMHECKSSQIHSIGYDPATNTMAVRFHNGGVYHYHDVSAERFQAMKESESVGKHLHANFKGKDQKYTKQPETKPGI